MAVFPGDPGHAIDAGLALHHAIHAYNTADRAPRGLPPLHVGVGINSGELMLGTVGSEARMDTTVISDAVNLASRLQKRTNELAARVLVGQSTFQQASEGGGAYHARLVEIADAAEVYEIYDADPPGAIAAKDATRAMFEQAVRAYHQHSFGDARRLFAVCAALDPSDPAVRYYVDRCEQLTRLLGGQTL
jgi:class 3 adenylate cyclase